MSTRTLEDLQSSILEWLGTPFARAILAIFVAILMAALVQLIFTRIVTKITANTKTELDDRLAGYYRAPITLSIVLMGIWYGASFFDFNADWETFLHRLIWSLVIFIWTLASLNFGSFLLDWLVNQPQKFKAFEPRTKPIFKMLLKTGIVLISAYLLIKSWGRDATAWLASAGVAGIAIGFAAKDTLANFITGIFIIADAPYSIGDYIVLESGERGRVTDVGLRSTRILTRDDMEIIIPNNLIGNAKIINESKGPYVQSRLKVPIGVAYGSDTDRVREIMLQCAEEEPLVARHPKPRIHFRSFGNSSLDFDLLVWVTNPEQRGQLLDQMLDRVYKAFAQNKIAIPFPQRDIHIKSLPPDLKLTGPGNQKPGPPDAPNG